MQNQSLNLIAIGYAKRALEEGSRERLRMKQYASVLGEYHLIVFTKAGDELPEFQQDGNLFLYGTNAKTRVGILINAIKIGRRITKQKKSTKWIVSSQDPFETSLVGRWIACGRKAVHHVQIHGDVFNSSIEQESLFQKMRMIYGRYVVRRTKAIRVVSERIKYSLELLGVQSSIITVLPIQADLESFLAIGRVRPAAAPDQPIRFLYVGRFSPEKNLHLLLEAFIEVATQNKSATLTLVGDGPVKYSLVKRIAESGLYKQIKFRDWTNNVAEVMQDADVFCLSSDHEGWGMVLVEAAAAGMAVVTTDVGCAGEFIKNNQQGLVVPVGGAAAYAAALQTYLSNPTLITEHGKNAHQAASEFSLTTDDYLHRFLDSYTFLD